MMRKKSFPLAQVYGLLEPGPVVMVTTAYKGKTNIMTMSWHTIHHLGKGVFMVAGKLIKTTSKMK